MKFWRHKIILTEWIKYNRPELQLHVFYATENFKEKSVQFHTPRRVGSYVEWQQTQFNLYPVFLTHNRGLAAP